mgnify:CR=1 FL=1
MNLSTIKSISFSNSDPKPATTDFKNEGGEKDVFKCSDFLVTDDSALVVML